MKTLNPTILLTSMLILLLSGCAEEVVVKRMKPAPAEPARIEPVEDLTEALAEFVPPYPEQVVLFEPDKKKPTKAGARMKATSSQDASSSQSEPEVELMGFGSVDAKFALLMIDGQVEALRVGEGHGNVRVLKIEPPRVQLRVAGRASERTLLPEQDG